MDNAGLHIMIFGASSGIAMAYAKRHAAEGASFTLVARDANKLKDISADLYTRGASNVSLCAISLDDLKASYAATLEIIERTRTPRIALIAHGLLGEQEELMQDPDQAQKLYQVNVMSTIGVLMALAKVMEDKGSGTIAYISSVAGDRGRASNFIYGSTKAALTAYTSGLRARLAARGVKVLTIKPGMVATAMTAHLKPSPLIAQPERVAADIDKAIKKGKDLIYTPWFWRWIMLIITHLPEFIFKKLKF